MKKAVVFIPYIKDAIFSDYLRNKLNSQKNDEFLYLFFIYDKNRYKLDINFFTNDLHSFSEGENCFVFKNCQKNEILDKLNFVNPQTIYFEDIPENFLQHEILLDIYNKSDVEIVESIIHDDFEKDNKRFRPDKFIFNNQIQLKKFVSLANDFDYLEIKQKLSKKTFEKIYIKNKSKKGFIITFFKTNYNTFDQLHNLIKSLLVKEFHIILASHSTVPEYIQELCDIYIFEELNLADQRKYSHGVAETSLIKKSLLQLKDMGIEWSYKVSYDSEFSDLSIFDNWINNYDFQFVSCRWANCNVSTNSFFGNVDFILENMFFPNSIEEMFEHSYFIEDIWNRFIIEKKLESFIYTYDSKESMFGSNIMDKNFFNYDELNVSFNENEKRFYISHSGPNEIKGRFAIVDYYTDLIIYCGDLNLNNFTLWVAPKLEFYFNDSVKNGFYLQVLDDSGKTTHLRNIEIKDFSNKIRLNKFYKSIKNDTLPLFNDSKFYEYLDFKNFKIYEKFKIQINEIKTFIDAGAHLGMFSIELLRQGATKAYLIEAEPKASEILKKNLGNSFIKIINKALSKNTGISYFNIFSNNNHNSMNSLINENNLEIDKKIEIESITADVLFENYIEEKEIDLFKIDIEGSEYDVFENFSETNILKCKSFLIEFHINKNRRVTKIIDMLINLGYNVMLDKYNQNDPDEILDNEMGIIYAKK